MTADGRQPHVLIVDDTRESLDLMRELLEEEGYRVSTSMAVLDPVNIRELAPDVIVQDLRFEHLPQGGGGFLSLMQLDPALARIPLILCTAAGRTIEQPEIERQLDHLGAGGRAQAVRHRGIADRAGGCPRRSSADRPGGSG